VLVAGKVIKLPGSGLVWQLLHSRPIARCNWWLYGIGCTGGVCSAKLSGTSFFASAGAAGCCAFTLSAVNSNATANTADANPATRTIRLIRTIAPPAFFIEGGGICSIFYDDLFDFLATTSSRLVPKSLRITVAAFRPGIPVTAPPGAVQAPV
jgi:hypothetical protein